MRSIAQEWRVTYQRAGWTQRQARWYQRKQAADDFVDKLLAHDRPDLAPLVLLCVDVRDVAPWAVLETVVQQGGAR